jgi:hypothetical protein
MVGMGLDSASTNWQIIANDNSGTAPLIDLGANFVKSTTDFYEFRLYCPPNGSDIKYFVINLASGNTASGTLSTAAAFPRNTVFMAPHMWITNNAQASAAYISNMRLYIESDF